MELFSINNPAVLNEVNKKGLFTDYDQHKHKMNGELHSNKHLQYYLPMCR